MKISETTKQITLLFGVAFPLPVTALMIAGGGLEALSSALMLHSIMAGCAFLAGCLHDWLGKKYGR